MNVRTQDLALDSLENEKRKNYWVKEIISQRNKLARALRKIKIVDRIYPSDSNFLLVRVNTDATLTYQYLMDNKIIVRDRSRVTLCYNCLRITIGTPEENDRLLQALKKL